MEFVVDEDDDVDFLLGLSLSGFLRSISLSRLRSGGMNFDSGLSRRSRDLERERLRVRLRLSRLGLLLRLKIE